MFWSWLFETTTPRSFVGDSNCTWRKTTRRKKILLFQNFVYSLSSLLRNTSPSVILWLCFCLSPQLSMESSSLTMSLTPSMLVRLLFQPKLKLSRYSTKPLFLPFQLLICITGTWNDVPIMIGTTSQDALLFVYKAFKNKLTTVVCESSPSTGLYNRFFSFLLDSVVS